MTNATQVGHSLACMAHDLRILVFEKSRLDATPESLLALAKKWCFRDATVGIYRPQPSLVCLRGKMGYSEWVPFQHTVVSPSNSGHAPLADALQKGALIHFFFNHHV